MDNLISRQEAIDAVLDRMDVEKHGRDAKPEEIRWTLERLPSAQPLDVQLAYYKGVNDGIEQCTERLKRLTDEMRRQDE